MSSSGSSELPHELVLFLLGAGAKKTAAAAAPAPLERGVRGEARRDMGVMFLGSGSAE